MEYKIGKSVDSNIHTALNEATYGLKNPKLILFFCKEQNLKEYTDEIKKKFNNSIIIGSSTFACFSKNQVFKDGIIVLGIENGIECYGSVLEQADECPLKYVDRIKECINNFKDTENTICFEVTTALRSCEELVLSTFSSVLEDAKIPLIGGSAGDEGDSRSTLISFNGKVYDNACAFVFIKNLNGKIKLYRENIYKRMSRVFTATKVDVKNRTVYEYDDRPAADVMTEILNTDVKSLSKCLYSYPFGRLVGNEMFITADNYITADKGIVYHARVYKNSRMVLLESDDYKKVIQNTIKKIKKDIPKPSFSIMVNCLARSILFESENYLDDFAVDMSQALNDYVGFSGYGEQFGGEHFNQTMVLAVFE